MDAATIEANREQQTTLYGRPLGEVVGGLTKAFGLSQARLAETLGLSAPMLSQLASAQRVKIGNPQVVARLQALVDLSHRAAELSPAVIAASLTEIAQRQATITDVTPVNTEILRVLRSVGNPEALNAAADAAQPHSQSLARLLRHAAEDQDQA